MNVLYNVFIFIVLQIGVIECGTGYSYLHVADATTKLCSKAVSFQASRNVPYAETYKERTWAFFYKTKVRWNYKTEYFTSWRTEYVCCGGYRQIRTNEHKDMALECEPVCHPSCGNGTCFKPNMCVCNPGYAEKKDVIFDPVCVPVCTRTCMHGKCTAPETCTCHNGYSLNADDDYTCEPVCVVPCNTGAYCSEPEVCTCLPGYSKKSTNLCAPICNDECVYGKCTAPDTCTCDDGYEADFYNIFICKPKCDHGCLYGKCTAPNVCTCDTGYSLKSLGICEPICNQTCVMGTCIAPETCSCFKGYGLLENSRYICEPFCEKACLNGKCTAPDECTCNEGFKRNSNIWTEHICEPHCEMACKPFGVCNAPNVCTCFDGYRLKNQTTDMTSLQYAVDTVCEPICHTPCINGFCSAPDECTCNDGYQPQINSNRTNVCDPICHPACQMHSNCVAPNSCICQNGYRMVHYDDVNISFRCEPICSVECGNGTCTAPEVCTCIDGYRNAETNQQQAMRCVPACSMCNNGTCVASEICECDDGFFLVDFVDIEVPEIPVTFAEDSSGNRSNGNGSRCMPRCERCGNGECVAPNECRCRAGYVKIEDNCVYACRNGCGTHGECVGELRSCKCHYGWTGLQCDQPTVCIVNVTREGNRIEVLNIVEEQNATINYVLLNNPVCPECIDEISNETLCFNMYTNGTNNETEIGCLIDKGCFILSGKYGAQRESVKISAIASSFGLLLLVGIIIAIYAIMWKYRNKQDINLENRTSMQGLVEQNTVDSEYE